MSAQQPQFQQGFGNAQPDTPRDPAESAAYAAASAETNPNLKVSALQLFINRYPNSSLRRPALSQIMLAQRAAHGEGLMRPAVEHAPPPSAAAAGAAAPVAAPSPVPRNSLLQQTARPAEIVVNAHSLAIKANNSALSQILHDISGSTGMKIEGLSKDERVFGDYGPGETREVLLALLEGSGYNVVMVGDVGSGAPRELSLTQRSMSVSTSPSGAAKASGTDDDDSDQDVQQVPPPEPPPQQGQFGNQPLNDGSQPQRSPQEILQQLQQQRQQQQQAPPPPQ